VYVYQNMQYARNGSKLLQTSSRITHTSNYFNNLHIAARIKVTRKGLRYIMASTGCKNQGKVVSQFVQAALLIQFLLFSPIETVNAISVLPQQLKQAAQNGLLVHSAPDLHILGTVHIGSQSAKETEALIEYLQPSNVVIEIPPSRLERIRSNIRAKKDKRDNDSNINVAKSELESNERPKSSTIVGAIQSYPALASVGWSKGGISGFLFSTAIVWPSLLKKSLTGNEEEETLPRRNEFEAAVEIADRVGANIIAADLEFDELIQSFVGCMSALAWIRLGYSIFGQSFGLLPIDPLKRQKGESLVEWECRRRKINTSRASRLHGENASPEISRVLVDERDLRFAEACLKAMEGKLESDRTTVCVVGLVHVDGIARRVM
jgi:hypothetical protein